MGGNCLKEGFGSMLPAGYLRSDGVERIRIRGMSGAAFAPAAAFRCAHRRAVPQHSSNTLSG